MLRYPTCVPTQEVKKLSAALIGKEYVPSESLWERIFGFFK